VSESVVQDGADVIRAVKDLGMGEAQTAQTRPGMDLIAATSTACSAAVR
jgi:hypothetical protein